MSATGVVLIFALDQLTVDFWLDELTCAFFLLNGHSGAASQTTVRISDIIHSADGIIELNKYRS